MPKEAVNGEGDGHYRFRGYRLQAASHEEGWRLLDEAYQEEQEQIARVQRMAKRATHHVARSVERDAFQRPGGLYVLRSPSTAYTEVFRGRFTVDEHSATFVEEGTWIRVVVEKAALHVKNNHRWYEKELDEKLYLALRAEHTKVKQRSREEKKKQLQTDQLPKNVGDLEVIKAEVTGELHYAYNGMEVVVTPRKDRKKYEADGARQEDRLERQRGRAGARVAQAA